MKAQGLSQIIVSATASVFYLTGKWIEPHERMLALYLREDGYKAIFGNAIFGLEEGELPIVTHKDGSNPIEGLAKQLLPGKIGIDKLWPSRFLIGLMEERRDIVPVIGSQPVDAARLCKDAQEQEALRKASAINDKVMTAAIQAIHEGVKEREIASLVNQLYLENGADQEGVQLVCFGANGADPHHDAGGTVISQGDSVILDIFTPISRYWCDMTRTVFFKQVSQKQQMVYDLVRRANETAERLARPGVPLRELDAVARKIIEEGGFGEKFTHRLGHNIGLECHELPDVSGVSEAVAQPGMVFSIEPGIYLPGEFGVRIEDLILITETGCEVLNKASKELTLLP